MAIGSGVSAAVSRQVPLILLAMVAVGLAVPLGVYAQTSPDPMEDELPFTETFGGNIYLRDSHFRLGYRTESYGQEDGQVSIGLRSFAPLGSGLMFFKGQFDFAPNSVEDGGVNIGGGFRRLYPGVLAGGTTRVFGISAWYDGDVTRAKNYFNQFGVSLESLGDLWDLRVNGNIPLGKTRQVGGELTLTDELCYSDNFLGRTTWSTADYASSVVEFEVARRVLDRNAWVFGGGYSLHDDEMSDFGYKLGARGYLNENLLLELKVSDDDIFGTNVIFGVVCFLRRLPTCRQGPCDICSRLREPVIRNEYIATRQEPARGCLPLTDEDDEFIRVVHVDSNATGSGDGTFESPLTSLDDVFGNSQQDDIVLVHSGSTFNGESVVLQDLQRLLGEGNDVEHLVTTSELGEVALPETSPGALSGLIPKINNAPVAAVILAQADDEHDVNADDYDPDDPISFNEVSNLSIDGGINGIVSSAVGIAEADINNMTIENTTGDGIVLTPFIEVFDDDGTKTRQVRFSPTITQSEFRNVGGDDIDLNATTGEVITTTVVEDIQIQNVESTNGNGWGINITNNKSLATIDQYKYNAGAASDGGIKFTSSPGGANVTSSAITGGIGTSGIGVSLVGATEDSFAGTFTFSDVTIENTGGAGLHVAGDATNVNFKGQITQANNAAAVYVQGDGDGAHTGTLNFNEMVTDAGVVRATAGTGLVFDEADGRYDFNHLVNLDDVSTGIDILDSRGTFNFNNVTIDEATIAAFRLDGGAGVNGAATTVNFTGTITQTVAGAGSAVDIRGAHTGTVNFNEKYPDWGIITATSGDGLEFANADGIYNFNNSVAIGQAGTTTAANINIQDDSGAGSDGRFNFSNVTIYNSTASAFRLNGGTADVDFTGKIIQEEAGVGAAVEIGGEHRAGTVPGMGSGTVAFKEQDAKGGIITASQGSGLQFANADGIYQFNDKIIVSGDTGTGATEGINIITDSDGTFTFKHVEITDVQNTAFNLNGGSADVTITGTITQSKNNAAAFSVGGQHDGTVNFSEKETNDGIIIASTGSGLTFNQADGTYDFNHAIELSGTAGIDIQDSDGTFNFHDTEITDSSIAAFNLNGGTANVDFTGQITQTANAVAAVNIEGGHTGTVNFNEAETDQGVIEGTAGTGLVFTNADGTYNFKDKIAVSGASGSGATAGISITTGSDGTFDFDKAILTDINSVAFNLNGGTADVAFTGKITQTKNNAAVLTIGGGHAAGTLPGTGTGTVTFDESEPGHGIITASMGTGLEFDDAFGAYSFNDKVELSGTTAIDIAETPVDVTKDGTYRFTGVVEIANTSGAGTALSANGGILEMSNSANMIDTSAGTGIAVDLNGVKIGSGGVKFESVSVDGAANGMVLTNLTGTGTFSVGSGGSSTGDGGTIQNTTGAGIAITNAAKVSLNNMLISTNIGGDGIDLQHNSAMSSNVTIADCTIRNTTGEGISLNATGAGSMRLTLNNNTIDHNDLQGINLAVGGDSTLANITLDGNSVANDDHEAVLFTASGAGAKTVNLLMKNNHFSNDDPTAVTADIQANGTVTLNTTVHTNTFVNSDSVSGYAYRTRTNDGGASVRLSLKNNQAANNNASDEYELINTDGSFAVEDLADVNTDNTGTVGQSGTIVDDPGGIPTP